MQDKLNALLQIMETLGSAVIAYSGGTDSSLLLKMAGETSGGRFVAVTIDSPTQPRREMQVARDIAAQLGAPHIVLPVSEIHDARFQANDPDRCYFCKAQILDLLLAYAQEHDYAHVLDGENADDSADYRPGRRATRERGIRSPLREAGLTKSEVRELARQAGLPNWNKPSAACLASRIPYGTPITQEILSQVEQAEEFLRGCGFTQLRVRHHGQVARLELEAAAFDQALTLRDTIIEGVRAAGFHYVALDLAGFRSGSMNETLGDNG